MLSETSKGFEVNRTRMRVVAKAMRDDLAALKAGPLRTIQNGPKAGGTVGKWDVPTDLGTKIDEAHNAMVATLELFVRRLEELIDAVDQTATNYDLGEQASLGATGRTSRPTISNTAVW